MGSIDTPEPKISLTQHQKLKYDHTQTVNEKKKNLALTAAGTAILTAIHTAKIQLMHHVARTPKYLYLVVSFSAF